MSSPKQIAANRENAKLSTGPTSPEGKKTSSLNAVKTGLTGRTVLLPTEDANAYTEHVARYFKEFAPPPCGHNEGDDPNFTGRVTENLQSSEVCPHCARIKELTQSVADTQWRLNRIPSLESAIYAMGSLEFANEFASTEDPAARAALIQGKTYLVYQRQISNLGAQEARLRRHFEKDRAELMERLAHRARQFINTLADAEVAYFEAKQQGFNFASEDIGFEFSIGYLFDFNAAEQGRRALRGGKFYAQKKEYENLAA